MAFLGTAGATGSIEMLFIAPEWRGRGIGARLVHYAVDELGCSRVEVNEQNTQAEGFYRRMGFVRRGRSDFDGEGKPYPILQLELADDEEGFRK